MLRLIGIAFIALAFGASARAGGGDIEKVNGSIHLEANQTGGDLTTVNGSIRLGDGAHAAALQTVNGSIDLGANAVAASANTVNGHVTLATSARIDKTVETVNGAITLHHNADVAGKVTNVNGTLTLDAAHVGGGLETAGGDMEIGMGSRVEGGLMVDEPSRLSSWFAWFERKPRIVIGPHAVVTGKIDIRREVDLFVSASATIDAVSGAKPIVFSGDTPSL
ncbi:MAG: hypothetical protein WBV61_08315 [Rhodanobacteraceae bacterium]